MPAKSPKYEPARQKIQSALSELRVDLQDMQATVDIALKDPAKFNLTPSELMSRQEFVRDLQAQANDALDELENAAARLTARGNQQRNDRQTLLTSSTRASDEPEGPSSSDAMSPSQARAWQDNEATIAASQQQQQQHIEEQDIELGNLGISVDRLGEMGRVIGDELRQQGRDLDTLNEEIDVTSDKMTYATNLMKKMLKKKDRGKLCAICGLSILLIILAYFAMS